MTEKIVKQALKIDFHIHSHASSHKDKDKVKNGTLDNLPKLVEKLIENDVNMISITDHDNFDYDIYKKLKDEENKKNCIKKVIPGVEFTVKIENSIIHIVTLFDDEDDSKIKNIKQYIYGQKPLYDDCNCFSEEKFLEILRSVDTNVVLIAHQKGSLSSKQPRKNDANTLENDKFDELMFIEYFEALEFKNKRNEIFNRSFLNNNKEKLKNIKFITGSDCHNWENYPEENSDGSFAFSYFKCLPTFRGIMMAITDPRRIKIGINSFFSKNNSIDKISLKIDEEEYEIELSEGINAIIGDNSIGKSLFLHKMTEYREISDKKALISAYESYLLENRIVINTIIPENKIRHFDKQGNIRDIFINNKTKVKDFLNDYYPLDPNYDNIKDLIIEKLNQFIQYLKKKKDILNEEKNLCDIEIQFFEEDATSLQINNIDIDLKDDEEKYRNLLSQIENIIAKNISLLSNALITEEEKKIIGNYNNFLTEMYKKYEKDKEKVIVETSKINIINDDLTKLIENLQETKTELQKIRESYNNKFSQLSTTISKLIKLDIQTKSYSTTIDEKELLPNLNIIGDYRFVCKASIQKIDSEYLKALLLFPLKSTYQKNIQNFNDINPIEFENNIKNSDDEIDKLAFYKTKVLEKIEKDFKIKPIINNKSDINVTKELSSGADAKIYFELLSKDKIKPGVYMIDQPEDDVSQPSIKQKLLDTFKQISYNRQILMITHNPQFIVNLDVDNIIFIMKDENNKIKIFNGALEYKDASTDILKIVADNIEGGIDSIRERYKKYEKNNQI